mmetsp:Transcript_21461/g.26390  ORF Transcript_21461/g.26390 Transcript_21461/m.26390 type:complete len:113 (+) Transcript_21461:1232-1570(+)
MNHDGIGLGLTIVKQIVEASGGSIIAESEGAAKGSTFILSMPFKPIMSNILLSETPDDNMQSFEDPARPLSQRSFSFKSPELRKIHSEHRLMFQIRPVYRASLESSEAEILL